MKIHHRLGIAAVLITLLLGFVATLPVSPATAGSHGLPHEPGLPAPPDRPKPTKTPTATVTATATETATVTATATTTATATETATATSTATETATETATATATATTTATATATATATETSTATASATSTQTTTASTTVTATAAAVPTATATVIVTPTPSPTSTPARRPQNLQITKVVWNPDGRDTMRNVNRERLRIRNIGSKRVWLTDYVLTATIPRRSGEELLYKFPRTSLRPGASLTLHSGAGASRPGHRYWFKRNPPGHLLGNRKGSVTLYDGLNRDPLDRASWSAPGIGVGRF